MQIDYVSRNFELDDRLREYAATKLGKLSRFLDEPVEVRLTLEQEKYRLIAELSVAHRHGLLQATGETEEMQDTINLVIDKLEKQARRSRKKYKDKRRRAARVNGQHQWPVEVLERGTLGDGTPRIIKSSKLSIKPMGLDEAAEQLEIATNDFVVFRDRRTHRVCVLYKRPDHNYGLISPPE
jgi:putative sigma-54 modulation protein